MECYELVLLSQLLIASELLLVIYHLEMIQPSLM